MSKDNDRAVIGIVAISHCRLAEEMLKVAELIVGRLEACKAFCFKADQPVEEMVKQLGEAIKELDQGKGVLILTDLFGGTPANISLSFLGPKVEVVCGMNLPMLIKLASCRKDHTLNEAAKLAKEYGQRHISLASEVLARTVKAE
ncbi:PTS sugar transporter subunit IIA [Desulforhabdus amnigena]|jgi:PTS system mannose-specific IIA component|uniref:PTS sugar transporter n=1 Tax=Desulforhabdus amnigena TaxID=40218 RepID=A0A9W6FWJ0_9BACT|nr:PTS sugar transporter subunit IIA [Desulforhabdus amnigena]NLJ29891.1 PTS sugar transporter subunit IIA [Deltaproteobacteria bacterium]GLI36191.1 PTS sugar transporter [Desulforhabdus amnigena]